MSFLIIFGLLVIFIVTLESKISLEEEIAVLEHKILQSKLDLEKREIHEIISKIKSSIKSKK